MILSKQKENITIKMSTLEDAEAEQMRVLYVRLQRFYDGGGATNKAIKQVGGREGGDDMERQCVSHHS